jgi:hypothetical protein
VLAARRALACRLGSCSFWTKSLDSICTEEFTDVWMAGRKGPIGRARNVGKPYKDTVSFGVAQGLVDARGDDHYRWRVLTTHNRRGVDRSEWYWHFITE